MGVERAEAHARRGARSRRGGSRAAGRRRHLPTARLASTVSCPCDGPRHRSLGEWPLQCALRRGSRLHAAVFADSDRRCVCVAPGLWRSECFPSCQRTSTRRRCFRSASPASYAATILSSVGRSRSTCSFPRATSRSRLADDPATLSTTSGARQSERASASHRRRRALGVLPPNPRAIRGATPRSRRLGSGPRVPRATRRLRSRRPRTRR